ncbi:MAG: PAAR domain-containing protein [Myxococcales bacterium]|nr:PAAR domain-containing protein [Myxococcales bacterium]
MGQLALAARESDTVGCHIGGGGSGSGSRFLSSALKWAAIGALAAGAVVGAIIAAPVILAAAGASAAVVAAAGTVAAVGGGTAGLSLAVIGGALSGASGGIKVQREAEAKPSSGGGGGGCGNITSGSHNVNIENKPAARAQQDTNIHPPSSPKLAEGSAYVYVNGKPLARIDDKSCCGGKIISACSRTYIGGPPTNGGGADASPIAGASFSWSNMDSWNWEGIETGLGVAGLAMGVGMAGVAVRGVAIAQGGFKALVTTSAGRVAAGKLTAGIGAGVGGGMAMSAAGEHIGGTIGGAGAGAVAGALTAEALANAMPFGAAGKLIKAPKVRLSRERSGSIRRSRVDGDRSAASA